MPALFQLCPDCPFHIDLAATEAPSCAFGPGEASAQVNAAALNFSVMSTNVSTNKTARLPAFDLSTSGSLNATASIRSGKEEPASYFIVANLTLERFNFTLVQSYIGGFDVQLTSELVQCVLEKVAIPIFNSEFAGIPIPSVDGLVLLNPAIGHFANELRVQADIQL